MTITDATLAKIGRMAVAFGDLDFDLLQMCRDMALQLGEDAPPTRLTDGTLDAIKSMARAHTEVIGADFVEELVRCAGDAKTLYNRRPDGVHGKQAKSQHRGAKDRKRSRGA